MVRFLPCDLEVMGSNSKNSLSACRVKTILDYFKKIEKRKEVTGRHW